VSVAQSIRKLGFRRWHERQLIEAHASLVTAFLCLIVFAVCLDQFRWRDGGLKPMIMLAMLFGGLVLCFNATRYYLKVLFRAEHFSEQAICGHCNVYGVLEVLSAATPESADSTPGSDWLKVRCRKCGHAWTMSEAHGPPPAGKSL